MSEKGEVVYEIRADDSSLESDLESAQKKVEKSTEKGAQKTEQIERDTSEAVKREKEQVTEHHKQQNDERVKDDKDTGKEREETEKSTGEKIKSLASGSLKAIGAGMAAVGSAAVAVGGMAVKSATDMDQALNQFMASTGLAEEYTVQLADGTVQVVNQAENYKKVMEEIYADNFGESFEDIATSMSEVSKQMTYLDDAQLKTATESALTLRDVFGYEVSESVRAANSMVDQFGISADEAFNLIAQGAQYGLDYSGELLDSINEYAPQFKKLGLDAEDMFQVFSSGTNAGAFNLDKIGDAVKELSIRVIDGSETTEAGFKAMGLNADDMAKKFGAGGETAKQAFRDVINGLASMEDPLAQNTAGVNLFGTMWEDLGGDVVMSLAEVNDGIDQTYDSMQELQDVKYDDLGSMFESLKRNVEMLLIPLGEELIPILSELIEAALPMIEEALPPLTDTIREIISQLAPLAEMILPVLMELFEELLPVVLQILNDVLPGLLDCIQQLLPPVMDIVSAILPALTEILGAILPQLAEILEALMPLINLIIQLLIPTVQILLSVFQEVFSGILTVVTALVKNAISIFENLIGFIKNVFTGNWRGAWENIKNIFKTIVDSLKGIFKAPINAIIDMINGFLKGLNKIKIPDWVPESFGGGKGFHIDLIPRLKKGMDFVPKDYFPAYLDYGERVLTREENLAFTAMGGLSGMERAMSAGMGQTYSGRPIMITVISEIDGREAARAMTEYVSEQLPWEEL